MKKLKVFGVLQIGFIIASLFLSFATDIKSDVVISNYISLSLGTIACLVSPFIKAEI